MLADGKILEVPGNFVEGEATTLLEGKTQVRWFLTAWYPADLEESLAVAAEEAASIKMLAGDHNAETGCGFADMTGVRDLGI